MKKRLRDRTSLRGNRLCRENRSSNALRFHERLLSFRLLEDPLRSRRVSKSVLCIGVEAADPPAIGDFRFTKGQGEILRVGSARSTVDIGGGRSISHIGLRVVVRRADLERPLCGKVEGSDVLKEPPRFSLGNYAHSSIRVQERQPKISTI